MNAGQFGFGGNAQQVYQEVTNNQFEVSMANFTDAHRSTQSVVRNLTDTNSCLTSSIPQLHQQMQMMQLMMQQQINNNNSSNRVRKKKSGKGNSWNCGGNSNSGGNIWNGDNSGGGGGNQFPINFKLFNNNDYC